MFKGKLKRTPLADEILAGRFSPVEHTLDAIRQLFEVAFDPNARTYDLFRDSRAVSGRYDLSGMALLAKAITSSSDTPFANFMKALNATDWVKAGHAHYVGHADGKCPFCQQKLPASYEKDIAECFDEQYQNDLLALEAFQSAYDSKMKQLLAVYQANLVVEYAKLDLDDYQDKLSLLDNTITINLQRIADKLRKPATIVTLEDTDALVAKLDAMVAEFNKQIQANNDIVATKQDKQRECFDMVWELIAFRMKDEVATYLASKKAVEDEVAAQDKKVKDLQEQHKALTREINDLSSKTINTKVTVDSINVHLADSGFEGFHLEENDGVKGVYKVVREDGTTAVNLSEGERNFIAFLYFYHVVRGSLSEVDSGKDKVVVIDDPVSSMDSSALFIVSALVREMIGVCSNNAGLTKQEYEGTYIQQIFILTHNAFFHREITYNMVRHYRYVSFFKVNKKKNVSTVELCVEEAKKVSDSDKNYNPVQNSYSALWTEYSNLTSTIPLMNVMRRILEYYFLQLCGYDGHDLVHRVLEVHKDDFITPIEGAAPDMTRFHLAKSMLAYMYSSETFNDGLNFVDESMDCDQYRDVFRTIFDALDQSQHYNRMMNETD
jgi:wobble nucleotide-excising tRNase